MTKSFLHIFFLVIFIFFTGCSQKKTLKDLDIDRMQELSIVNTKKVQMGTKDSKVIIVATYLNPIDVDVIDQDKENFLVGLYFDNLKKDKNSTPLYRVTLNGSDKGVEIKRVEKDSPYLKMSPLVNKWSDYYLVRFPKNSSNRLILVFEDKNGSKAQLNFEKEF
jgi:hypothetical protein